MRERHLVRSLVFVDTVLGAGETVEEHRPNHCPDGAVRACHARGWSVAEKLLGQEGEPTIILDQTGRWRVVSSVDLG